MIPEKLAKFFKKHKVMYEIIVHPARFTSDETAQAEHVSGKEIAKVVMVKAQGKDVMTVLPASHSIDFLKLSSLLGTQDVRMERESEFVSLFEDCEAGAMPPFGKLYKVPCYVDKSLKEANQVTFNAGNHKESVRIWTQDFFRIIKAELGDFAQPGKKLAAGSGV